MRFEVTGKAAHSGANFEMGISAINELAHKMLELRELSDPKAGITLNVGVVSGGQTVNTVAPWAKGEVDLRFITPAQRAETFAKVEEIMAKSFVPGASAKLEITGEFVPLVENAEGKALYEHYAAALKDLGVPRPPRCSPAAAPIPDLPRRPARRPSARSARSAAGRIRRRSISRSRPWCRVPGAGAGGATAA